MTTTAAILILVSAFMHASWNIFSKRQSPTLGFFLLASLGTTVAFSPIFIKTLSLIPLMSLRLWGILIVAGLFQAIYYCGLAGAYARGAMSIAYPIARAFPLLLVVMFTFFVGRGHDLSSLAIAGALTIVTGAFILPMDHFRDIRLGNYINPSCGFALVAAIGTAGYSFIDDIGMHALKAIPDHSAVWHRALFYLVLESLFTAFWLQFIMLFARHSSTYFRANWKNLIRPAFWAGVGIGATYGIILLAMTHATNVSYVVGLRQISIPIGTIMGILILKEKATLPRFYGAAILFIGLVLISIG